MGPKPAPHHDAVVPGAATLDSPLILESQFAQARSAACSAFSGVRAGVLDWYESCIRRSLMKQGVIWGVTCGALWALTACSSAVHDSPPAVAQPMPGKVTTFVGDGTQGFDGDGHAPLDSWLDEATELGFAADGTLYIDDWNSHRIRCVTAQGTLGTMVGSSFPGDWPPSTALTDTVMGDTLAINHPMDLAFEANQKILIAGWHNHKLFELDPNTDSVRVLAGGNKPGYSGDGAAAQ